MYWIQFSKNFILEVRRMMTPSGRVSLRGCTSVWVNGPLFLRLKGVGNGEGL